MQIQPSSKELHDMDIQNKLAGGDNLVKVSINYFCHLMTTSRSRHCCLWPKAKDLGITWLVVLAVIILLRWCQLKDNFKSLEPSGNAVASSISRWMTLSFLTNLAPVMILLLVTLERTERSDQYLSDSGPGASHLQRQYEQCQNNQRHQLSTLILSVKIRSYFDTGNSKQINNWLMQLPKSGWLWPDVGIKSSQFSPQEESGHFYLKSDVFQNSPESHQTFGFILKYKQYVQTFQN